MGFGLRKRQHLVHPSFSPAEDECRDLLRGLGTDAYFREDLLPASLVVLGDLATTDGDILNRSFVGRQCSPGREAFDEREGILEVVKRISAG